MFYSYAEKPSFIGKWDVRQVAFDTTHRYLYYSSKDLKQNEIAEIEPLPPSKCRPSNPVSPVHEPPELTFFGTQRTIPFREAPKQPNKPSDVVWEKKYKVTAISRVAIDRRYSIKDTNISEFDFYQVSIVGEERPLAPGEIPPAGPLLCPSAGLSGLPDRMRNDNEEFIRDPFFLKEIFLSLKQVFDQLHIERERLAAGGADMSMYKQDIRTLPSPHNHSKSRKKDFVLRLRSEYEFLRFYYTVRTVLGYDRLCTRLFRGLPPYDPRNGLTFATVPMTLWNKFDVLEEVVFYTLVCGDVAGRDASGELTVSLKNAYLCITHDMVLILRGSGSIPKWIPLKNIKEFYYNHTCHQPYVVFVGEAGVASDLIFVPQPPVYGRVARARFNPIVETLRIHRILYSTCFSSFTEARKVIHMAYTPEPSVRSFVEVYEDRSERQMTLDNLLSQGTLLSCPLPKEQLGEVWQEVNEVFRQNRAALDQIAIPLYANHSNNVSLTADQVSYLQRNLPRRRGSSEDIVGMPLRQAQAEAQIGSHRTLHHQDPLNLEEADTEETPRVTRGSINSSSPALTQELLEATLQTPMFSRTTARSSENGSFASHTSVIYSAADARYITQEELAEAGGGDVPADRHIVLSNSVPEKGGRVPFLTILNSNAEPTLKGIVEQSFNALEQSPLHKQLTEDMET